MGQYNKAVLTAAGENLIARTLAGEIQLNITKAKTSNYIYPAGTDFKSLTDMQGIKQTATDPVTAVYNDTMIQTRVLFSNEEIASTYYIHNIGLYAMDGTQEVLFCIVTAESPDEMPQYNGVASTSYIYNIQNVVQDAAQLNITVNPSGTATIQDVLERVDATGGNISETVIETLETVEDKYPVPAAGESVKRFFGKVLTFLKNIKPPTENINIYVSTTGSDVTGDGTSVKPFKTIQFAIDRLPKDLGGYTSTITVTAGTYAEDITIAGFHNGVLNLYSDTKLTLTGTCHVRSVYVKNCGPGYINVNGFDLTTTSREAILVHGSYGIYIDSCQSTVSAPAYTGIQINESYCSISGCKIANRNHAVSFSNSRGVSAYWNSGSTGNVVGLSHYNGSIVTSLGEQPLGATIRAQGAAGVVFYENGTQIRNITNAGLSCTWGTIYEGYVRHGNMVGAAMVTIQCRVVITTSLTAGGTYYVNGFPPIAIAGSAVAVSVHDKQNLSYCQLNDNGSIQFYIKNTVPAGNYFVFNCTYLTNS